MAIESGDFELSVDELRVIARYAVEAAQEVLPLFEESDPNDRRPPAAVEAAWTFVEGANRTKLQRITALEAHRAAKDATKEYAKHAAHAAGDAAAAAYLHPLARATQVGHILRAAAHAARAAEPVADSDPNVGDRHIEQARQRAASALVDVPSDDTGRIKRDFYRGQAVSSPFAHAWPADRLTYMDILAILGVRLSRP